MNARQQTEPSAAWQVAVGADETAAAFDPPATDANGAVVLCAHGAGGHMNDRAVLAVRDALCARGFGVVRFNFLYKARGSSRPDPMPRLIDCYQAVIDRTRTELQSQRLIIGGRSMGGRAGSVLVSEGAACDGLLLLAYPLHPPGQLHKLRDAHLPAITARVLCINGTRDPFSDRQLMEKTLSRLGANWRMHWVDGADHSFHVLKSSGRNDQDVMAEVGDTIQQWVSGAMR